MSKSTRSRRKNKTSKPTKPYRDFPLFPHATKRWAKKIRGQLHYFGRWSDPDGALEKYLAQKDDLHAGMTPKQEAEALTIKDQANAFMRAIKEVVDAGELSPRTWADYHSIMKKIQVKFRTHRLVADLGPEDFVNLKISWPRRMAPPRM